MSVARHGVFVLHQHILFRNHGHQLLSLWLIWFHRCIFLVVVSQYFLTSIFMVYAINTQMASILLCCLCPTYISYLRFLKYCCRIMYFKNISHLHSLYYQIAKLLWKFNITVMFSVVCKWNQNMQSGGFQVMFFIFDGQAVNFYSSLFHLNGVQVLPWLASSANSYWLWVYYQVWSIYSADKMILYLIPSHT